MFDFSRLSSSPAAPSVPAWAHDLLTKDSNWKARCACFAQGERLRDSSRAHLVMFWLLFVPGALAAFYATQHPQVAWSLSLALLCASWMAGGWGQWLRQRSLRLRVSSVVGMASELHLAIARLSETERSPLLDLVRQSRQRERAAAFERLTAALVEAKASNRKMLLEVNASTQELSFKSIVPTRLPQNHASHR